LGNLYNLFWESVGFRLFLFSCDDDDDDDDVWMFGKYVNRNYEIKTTNHNYVCVIFIALCFGFQENPSS
jgi:hypothetical protein